MEAAGADYRIEAYPGAKHSFTNPDADKMAEKFEMNGIAYDKAADEQSWADMKAFLAEIFAD
jgi:dienelactone hydrolase